MRGVHRLQPADRGEQAEPAAAGGEEQRAIGRGQLRDVAAPPRRCTTKARVCAA